MYGQQLPRLEEQVLRPVVELKKASHPACTATELDDVAALHGGRGDFDVGNQRTAGNLRPHNFTSTGAGRLGVEWHGQSHAS